MPVPNQQIAVSQLLVIGKLVAAARVVAVAV
jgi:hypothetical protein